MAMLFYFVFVYSLSIPCGPSLPGDWSLCGKNISFLVAFGKGLGNLSSDLVKKTSGLFGSP